MGAPWGICSALLHSPALVWSSAGSPPTSTREAGTAHCTVTQGCGLGGEPGIVKGHPATVYVSLTTVTGWPPTSTRVLLGTGVACPPWGQVTVAPRWRRGPVAMAGGAR